jgi:hypothetical protein
VTQLINTGESVEERLEDIHISDQTNVPDKQEEEIRQNAVGRIVCAYHPGRVREKVFRVQKVNCNADPLGSDSHAASYMPRPLGVFHRQNILQS